MLATMRAIRAFNPREWVNQQCAILNTNMLKNGFNSCTMSVGGDVTSAVIYGICTIASKQPYSPIQRVVGIAQPLRTTASHWRHVLDLEHVFGGKVNSLKLGELIALTKTTFNSRREDQSFVRLSNKTDDSGRADIVRGPCEDGGGYLMYYCGADNGVVDAMLVADLHKSELIAVARELGVPSSIQEYSKDARCDWEKTAEEMMEVSDDFMEVYSEVYSEVSMLSKVERAKFIAELDTASLAMFTELSAKADEILSYYGRTPGYPKNLTIIPVPDPALP
jgi:NH3-dependent NAD+ synthetase